MSINRQIASRRGSPRATVARSAPGPAWSLARRSWQGASRARSLFLVAVGGLALAPAGAGGPAASLASSRVAAAAPGAAALGGVGQATPTSGTVASVPGQGAVEAPRVLAKAGILADEATGQVLYERNAGAARAMASTTKVMTALLAFERLDERKVVTIGSGPPQGGGGVATASGGAADRPAAAPGADAEECQRRRRGHRRGGRRQRGGVRPAD